VDLAGLSGYQNHMQTKLQMAKETLGQTLQNVYVMYLKLSSKIFFLWNVLATARSLTQPAPSKAKGSENMGNKMKWYKVRVYFPGFMCAGLYEAPFMHNDEIPGITPLNAAQNAVNNWPGAEWVEVLD